MTFKQILHRLNRRDTRLLPKNLTLSKIILILLAVFVVTFTSKTIIAQTKLAEEFKAKQSAFDKGNNAESWIKESVSTNVMVGVNTLAGTIPDSVINNIGTTNTSTSMIWQPQGLIGTANKGISMLYSIPISGVEYIAQVKDNFLGKPSYAATGFESMSPIIPIWKSFRNATYIMFSLVFLIIGIMIMLRIKISPQTTINIQNAIPKLITSLILVTFSYAIVGLLIDFSYLIEALLLSVINSSGTVNNSISDTLKDPNIFGKLFNLVPLATLSLWAGIISVIIGGVSAVLTFGLGWWLGLIAFGVILLILLILVFWYTLKFFIGLLKCYITVIVKTIIGPFEIALGAIPNMKMGFGSWLTDIFANIMVFPISVVFLVMVEAIINATSGKTFWAPPGVDSINFWTASYLSGGILPVALGLGSLMIVSKLPKIIPEFIFKIKPTPFGKDIGDGAKGAGKVFMGVGKLGVDKGMSRFDEKFGQPGTPNGTRTKPQEFRHQIAERWKNYREKGPRH